MPGTCNLIWFVCNFGCVWCVMPLKDGFGSIVMPLKDGFDFNFVQSRSEFMPFYIPLISLPNTWSWQVFWGVEVFENLGYPPKKWHVSYGNKADLPKLNGSVTFIECLCEPVVNGLVGHQTNGLFTLVFVGYMPSYREPICNQWRVPASSCKWDISTQWSLRSSPQWRRIEAGIDPTDFPGTQCCKPTNTWRIIPVVSKWLGSPKFISHEVRPFGRGTARTRSLRDNNDHS